MKRIVILGSTGSIGTQCLNVIRRNSDRFQVVGLAARQNRSLLLEQAQAFRVQRLALYEGSDGDGIRTGMAALCELATADDVDMVVVSVAGVIGLNPTIAAIRAGKQIALASKEILVAAGEIVMPMLDQYRVTMRPIDSEHSAVFQCLQGYSNSQIDQIILTASGGPFRGRQASELEGVTRDQALQHPTWAMGGKITIDSATLMNKGLEMIEAKWLFGVGMDQVRVVLHPQSIVHSLVRFTDGSALGQLGWPNMELPIQIALSHPEKLESGMPVWDPVMSPTLTFEEPDLDAFPSPNLAREAERSGGTMPAVLNAANEDAANAFLREEVGFMDIARIVEQTMLQHDPMPCTLENILEADRWARSQAQSLRPKTGTGRNVN